MCADVSATGLAARFQHRTDRAVFWVRGSPHGRARWRAQRAKGACDFGVRTSMKSKKLVSSTVPVWLDVISVPVLSETIMVMISPSGTGYTARIPRQEACKRTHL